MVVLSLPGALPRAELGALEQRAADAQSAEAAANGEMAGIRRRLELEAGAAEEASRLRQSLDVETEAAAAAQGGPCSTAS